MDQDLERMIFGAFSGGMDTPETYLSFLKLVGWQHAQSDAVNQSLSAWKRAAAIQFMAGQTTKGKKQ